MIIGGISEQHGLVGRLHQIASMEPPMIIGGIWDAARQCLRGELASMEPPMIIGGIGELLAAIGEVYGESFNGAADDHRRNLKFKT